MYIMFKFNKISPLIALLILLSSCNLDKYPYDAIEQSQAFQTVKDATTFRNGLYSYIRNLSAGQYTYVTDFQSDLLNATTDFGNRGGLIYRWEFVGSDYNLRDMWSSHYSAIANINVLLDNIDKIPTTTPAEADLIKQYKGEAYLMRAFCYYRLALRFAKDYEPSTATTDLGLPIVLTYDPNARPARATLKETFDQIKLDLGQAKTLLVVAGARDSYYLTADAVSALEARVYLTTHEWTNAITAADKIISSTKYPLIDNATDLEKMWKNDTGSEIICKLFAATTELNSATQMNVFIQYNTTIASNTPDFVPQKWVVDLYADNDIRKNVYLKKDKITIQSINYTDVYMINKYPGNPALFTTAVSNYYQMPKLFRSAEAYLIKAEAAFRVPDEPTALSTLNILRNKRGLASLSGLTGAALLSAIQEERTREMLCEGTRLDDLKRWQLGVTRTTPQNSAMVVTGPTASGLSVTKNDMRFVWEIPSNDIQANPNLKPNWN